MRPQHSTRPAAVTAQAKQEVAMETAAKRRAGGKTKAGDAKSQLADKKQEMMANMSSRIADAADAADAAADAVADAQGP